MKRTTELPELTSNEFLGCGAHQCCLYQTLGIFLNETGHVHFRISNYCIFMIIKNVLFICACVSLTFFSCTTSAGQLRATQQLLDLQDQLDAAALRKNVDSQISILEQLDKSGSEYAKYLLATTLIEAARNSEEISRAIKIISKSYDSADKDLTKLDALISYEYEKENRSSAFEKALHLANDGYDPAVFLASQMYLVGDGTGTDPVKAFNFSQKITPSSRYAEWKIPKIGVTQTGSGKSYRSHSPLTFRKLALLRNAVATVFSSRKLINKTKVFIDDSPAFSLRWNDTHVVITSPREVTFRIAPDWASVLGGCVDQTTNSIKAETNLRFIFIYFGGAQGCPEMVSGTGPSNLDFSVWLEDFASFDDLIFWNENDRENLQRALNEEKSEIIDFISKKMRLGLNQEFQSIRSELDRIAREGDGSEDDLICKNIHKVATAAYLACRSKLADQRVVRSKASRVIPESRAAKNITRTGGQSVLSSDSPFGRVALSLEKAAKKCRLLGFKDGTEKFGKCVLQLSQ